MTTLVYRDGRDLGRGGFPFIHYKQTCTDGIGEALQVNPDTLTWNVTRHITILASYVHFFAGPFLKETPPGKDMWVLGVWVLGVRPI